MRYQRIVLWLLPLLAGGAALGISSSRRATVLVIRPETKVVAETVAASGEVRGQTETNVGARISGRVSALLVESGDSVRAGQVIARLDDTVLRTEVDRAREALRTAETGVAQAEEAIRSAEAQVALAARKPLASDMARTRAETTQNVAVAEAKLASAQAHLTELERGATAEQRAQVGALVSQAAVTLKKADRDLERQRGLYASGAAAKVSVEDAQAARDTALQALENLRARQQEVETGTRAEQVAQARADLRAAEATLAGAKVSGEAQMRSLLALPRSEDVSVARTRLGEARGGREAALARFHEAQTALEVARRQREETVVTVPFAGTITSILTEVGAVTGPNQPLVKLVRTSRPEIRVALDEDNLGRLQVGQKALVTADAFPGVQVRARVRQIGAEVNTSQGQVEVKLDLEETPVWLRPGQTLTVNLIVNPGSPRLTVPLSAVTTAGNVPQVLVVENGVVRQRRIEIGGTGPEGVVVKSGLDAHTLVVKSPDTASPGQKVEARIR